MWARSRAGTACEAVQVGGVRGGVSCWLAGGLPVAGWLAGWLGGWLAAAQHAFHQHCSELATGMLLQRRFSPRRGRAGPPTWAASGGGRGGGHHGGEQVSKELGRQVEEVEVIVVVLAASAWQRRDGGRSWCAGLRD